MEFDFEAIDAKNRYKLLVSTIVPRPIALVTTVSVDGHVNAAPFSFFNVVGSDPALVVLGVSNRPDGSPKDTAANILASKEFVVNLVSESITQQMNICAIDFPSGCNELHEANLTAVASSAVKPPRIAESPVNFECRLVQVVEIGRNRTLLGEVLSMHIRDDVVDAENFYVNTSALHLIGRTGGAGGYVTTRDHFEIPRISYSEWQLRRNG